MATPSITFPTPLKLQELTQRAEELTRTPREFVAPIPVLIPVPQGEVDSEAIDLVATQAFSTLHNSDKYSDLVIKCQDRVWRAHKAVVCSQSKVLAACVDGPFRESQTNEIDLSDDEPEIVSHMIEYLYKGFYDFETPISAISYTPDLPPLRNDWISRIWKPNTTPSDPSKTCPPAISPDITPHYATSKPTYPSSSTQITTSKVAPIPSRLITHASVYCIAEQYDLPRLKNYALCKYAIIAPTAWKSPFFIPSLALIYERTPSRAPETIDDLRAIAVKIVAENSWFFLDKPEFLRLCVGDGEMATDVMRMMLVVRERQVPVGWKAKVECKVDKGHELVFIPQMTGFGVGKVGQMSIQGFGRTTGGKYRCVVCGHIVK